MKRQEDIIQFPAERARAVEPVPFAKPLMRGAADTFFRRWRWIAALWGLATLAALLSLRILPRQYESEMTFLVKNVRSEVVVSGDGTTPMRSGDVTDGQIATEVQMLSSHELADDILSATGFSGGTRVDRENAIGKLQKALQIMPVMKSSMIRVRYSSSDPKQSARVLEAMAKAYLDRHLKLHGTSGSLEFFEAQSAEAQTKLSESQDKLLKFQQASGVVSATEQKDMLLQRSIELRVGLQAAEAELRETTRKMATLKDRSGRTAARIPTQMRRMPNQYSIERLNTLLIELKNRRTELVTKFKPTDRVVTQLDQQIADTQKALQGAEGSIATEEASDINPLRQTLDTELNRAEADVSGLRGRIAAMREQGATYKRELARLETLMPQEQQFVRDARVAEDNYLLYAKKQEEARIGEKMDQQKIANVVLAEAPREPALPKGRMGTIVPAYLLALLAGLAVVSLFNRMKKTVYTPWELEVFSAVPVLGTVPVRLALPAPRAIGRNS